MKISHHLKEKLDILLSHEITHLFQFSQLNDETNEQTLGEMIFSEGIATYASKVMAPGFELKDYLYIESGFEEWMEAAELSRVKIKDDILENIDSKDFKYRRLYLQGDNSIVNGIPKRVGYLVGYRVIEHLNNTFELNDLISWSKDRIKHEVEKAIAEIG